MFLCHFPSPGAAAKLPQKPGSYPAPCPVEPGLSSPAGKFPPRRSPGFAWPLQVQSSIGVWGGQGRGMGKQGLSIVGGSSSSPIVVSLENHSGRPFDGLRANGVRDSTRINDRPCMGKYRSYSGGFSCETRADTQWDRGRHTGLPLPFRMSIPPETKPYGRGKAGQSRFWLVGGLLFRQETSEIGTLPSGEAI